MLSWTPHYLKLKPFPLFFIHLLLDTTLFPLSFPLRIWDVGLVNCHKICSSGTSRNRVIDRLKMLKSDKSLNDDAIWKSTKNIYYSSCFMAAVLLQNSLNNSSVCDATHTFLCLVRDLVESAWEAKIITNCFGAARLLSFKSFVLHHLVIKRNSPFGVRSSLFSTYTNLLVHLQVYIPS